MDGDKRTGREGGGRRAKDQSGGRARQLRTRCRKAVGRAPNRHQRSGARVRRTADGDLTSQESSVACPAFAKYGEALPLWEHLPFSLRPWQSKEPAISAGMLLR